MVIDELKIPWYENKILVTRTFLRCVSVTLGSIVVIFSNRVNKRDIVVDRVAIGSFGEISFGTTNGKCNESEPFERTYREPLDVIEGDGERRNVFLVDFQMDDDVDHF